MDYSIIIIAVIWFVFRAIIKANNAQKKNAQKQADAGDAPAAAAPKREPAKPQSKPSNVWAQINDMIGDLADEGASESDDAGCVGGSMTHDLHEGAMTPGSLAYTAPTIEHASVSVRAPEPPTAAATHPMLAGANAPDWMRAIVLSEILAKPVALRRAGRR